jgi:hypothetical protein
MERITNAILTGPTGAIGLALIDELIRRGVRVTAVCRPGSARMSDITPHPLVRVVEFDLGDLRSLTLRCTQDYDVFYHLGWASTFGAAARGRYGRTGFEYSISRWTRFARLRRWAAIHLSAQAVKRSMGALKDCCGRTRPCFPENGLWHGKTLRGRNDAVESEKLGLRHIWTRISKCLWTGDGAGTLVSTVINALLDGQTPACTAGRAEMGLSLFRRRSKGFFICLPAAVNMDQSIRSAAAASARSRVYLRDKGRDDPALPIGFGQIPYASNQVTYLGADLSAFEQRTLDFCRRSHL